MLVLEDPGNLNTVPRVEFNPVGYVMMQRNVSEHS